MTHDAEGSDYEETEEPITVIGTEDRRMLLKHTNQTLSREQLHKKKTNSCDSMASINTK